MLADDNSPTWKLAETHYGLARDNIVAADLAEPGEVPEWGELAPLEQVAYVEAMRELVGGLRDEVVAQAKAELEA